MARKHIVWNENELNIVADEAAQLMLRGYPEFEAISTAQGKLPLERRRKCITLVAFGKPIQRTLALTRERLHKILPLQSEATPESVARPPEFHIPEEVIEKIIQEVEDRVMARVRAIMQRVDASVPATLGVPQCIGTTPDQEQIKQEATPQKLRVFVIGLPLRTRAIKEVRASIPEDFRDRVDVKFYTSPYSLDTEAADWVAIHCAVSPTPYAPKALKESDRYFTTTLFQTDVLETLKQAVNTFLPTLESK